MLELTGSVGGTLHRTLHFEHTQARRTPPFGRLPEAARYAGGDSLTRYARQGLRLCRVSADYPPGTQKRHRESRTPECERSSDFLSHYLPYFMLPLCPAEK